MKSVKEQQSLILSELTPPYTENIKHILNTISQVEPTNIIVDLSSNSIKLNDIKQTFEPILSYNQKVTKSVVFIVNNIFNSGNIF